MKAAIIFGSTSDKAVMKKAADVLREFGVEFSAHVISAHRTPELLTETLKTLEAQGVEVIIAGAGLAAHLPGVIASQTQVPVIGVPISSGGLGGLDALLSIVQMPKPIPVASVGVDNGANAAYLACEILSIKYSELKEKLAAFRIKMKADFARDNSLSKDGGVEL
ncbi:phosphoribosylaminoimidazole carboxylase, catalytic subunit [Treponema primitia ZAS-2]|uniref:N5-carboxyaminoimidazole ribonucleotide mutase n=1 Tax=Treponema primitia (strain ATCC BAA-887 / DSM 12427 / ZAS-2) TaxID=545694 RepID=F5YPQ4_TREPZ|nr:5-(carboxyamino)imidazole ribonucleotide mutase [Treponema primitia]AEF84010.1 phosphoribosylaminoimidazole carboxylase, catalytic subunit [Treponema primitia ZAS-2]